MMGKSLFKTEQEALEYRRTHGLHGRVAEPVAGTAKWALNFPLEGHLDVRPGFDAEAAARRQVDPGSRKHT